MKVGLNDLGEIFTTFILNSSGGVNISGWIAIKFGTDIHGPPKVNPNDCGDPLTVPLAPP